MERCFANHALLLVRRIEEAKAVLKSSAIADFSQKSLRIERAGKVEFELYRIMHLQFARNRCAQPGLADVFCAPVESRTSLDDQPLVHGVSRGYARR